MHSAGLSSQRVSLSAIFSINNQQRRRNCAFLRTLRPVGEFDLEGVGSELTQSADVRSDLLESQLGAQTGTVEGLVGAGVGGKHGGYWGEVGDYSAVSLGFELGRLCSAAFNDSAGVGRPVTIGSSRCARQQRLLVVIPLELEFLPGAHSCSAHISHSAKVESPLWLCSAHTRCIGGMWVAGRS